MFLNVRHLAPLGVLLLSNNFCCFWPSGSWSVYVLLISLWEIFHFGISQITLLIIHYVGSLHGVTIHDLQLLRTYRSLLPWQWQQAVSRHLFMSFPSKSLLDLRQFIPVHTLFWKTLLWFHCLHWKIHAYNIFYINTEVG